MRAADVVPTCECDPMGEGLRSLSDHNLWCPRWRENRICDHCGHYRSASRDGNGWICDVCKGKA